MKKNSWKKVLHILLTNSESSRKIFLVIYFPILEFCATSDYANCNTIFPYQKKSFVQFLSERNFWQNNEFIGANQNYWANEENKKLFKKN
jgi:hypothetical protein